jgi:mannose-6-phosphate isomerase-like protein (cupin superfamily)
MRKADIQNLKLPATIKKPWGHEYIFALTKNYAGKILVVNKGHRLSLQYHKKKEETLHLLKGVLRLKIEDARGRLMVRSIKPGISFTIKPKRIHRMEAVKDCEIIEVSTPELHDVVRVDDDYNRSIDRAGNVKYYLSSGR